MKDLIKRDVSAEAFNEWLNECSQPLLISSPPYTGKTTFVKQISAEAECAAAHYCSCDEPASIDTASLLRNLATQLVRQFPNLVLPYLSSVTLLADVSSSIDYYLALPLASLPLPPKPLFIVIDNALPETYDVIFKLQSSLPSWLKLVVTTRTLPAEEQSLLFFAFHSLSLSGEELEEELRVFAHARLPQCCEDEVVRGSMGSWFYVDQVGRALDYGLLQPDQLPMGTEQLLQCICSSPAIPSRLSIYLMLIKASRRSPSHADLLSVAQIIINDVLPSIQKDMEDLCPILACTDPVVLSGSWVDFEGDLAPYHAAWADHFKMKKRKSPQDLVELAYHLAHSDRSLDESLMVLHSLGASQLSLACPVFDERTTELLQRVGCRVGRAEEQEDFVFLCSLGDLTRVIHLLGNASPPLSPTVTSLGFLAAASRGHVEVCEEILDRRPETYHSSSTSHGQWNALRAAACGNHLGVLEMLIKRGVPVDECGNGGRTALRAAAWAGHRQIVACLLKAKADVEKKDSEGRTALMAAAFMENNEIVEDLLKGGADVNVTDSSGATGLHLVLSNGRKSEKHRATLKTLLAYKANVNLIDSHGRSSIHLAAYHGDEGLETIARYAEQIDLPDRTGRTPLMLAASQGQIDAVQMLVSRGADIDAIDNEGRTALILGAINGHLSIVDLLLSMGADECHKDNEGATALHYAVRHKCVQLTRALATTATVSTCDSQGNTPLIVAAEYPNVEVISELLHSGASPTSQSLHGQTAVRVAALAGHVKTVRLLAERVSDWDQKDVEGTPLLHSLLLSNQLSMVATLLELGVSPSTRDHHGRTAAHIVTSRDDLAAARLLLKTTGDGAIFEQRDDGGRTSLMTAVWAGHYSIASFLLEVAGVDPNAVDKQGASSLSIAVQLGHRELVHLLLRLGADPSIRDKAGRTAHDVARITGKENIRVMLKSATGSADSSGFGSMPGSPREMNRTGSMPPGRTSMMISSNY